MPKNFKRLVHQQIRRAGFPLAHSMAAEKKILYALRNVRLQQKIAKNLYGAIPTMQTGQRPKRSVVGRPSKSAQTTYLISTLKTVWMQGFQKKASVNRRGFKDSKFMIFAEPILHSVGIYNAIDNVIAFNTYRNRLSKIIDRRGSVIVTMKIINP